ncbi:MAG: hypothetical protein PVF05_00095 [Gemmatimonadales bacterium]|jgi:hypothetical protein
MTARRIFAALLVAAGLAGAPSAAAQVADVAPEPLAVGTKAPDFTLVGADADGVLSDSIRPTDFRGHTLVIAFFFRARSSG